MARYGMKGTPTPILIDRRGRLRKRKFGFEDDLDLGGPGIRSGMAVAMTGAARLLVRRFRRQARRLAAQS